MFLYICVLISKQNTHTSKNRSMYLKTSIHLYQLGRKI